MDIWFDGKVITFVIKTHGIELTPQFALITLITHRTMTMKTFYCSGQEVRLVLIAVQYLGPLVFCPLTFRDTYTTGILHTCIT